MQLSDYQLKAVAVYASGINIAKYLPMINATLDKYSINTPMRICHFLAQIIHESGSFRYTTELDSGQAYEGRADLGNTQPGDGPLFKGRGFIQLTGRENYDEYGGSIGVDLISNPELVATDYPADVSGWFWNKKNLNALADQDGLTAITERINGGTNGLQDRLFFLGKAKAVLMSAA
jgi:putative chitinase